MRQASKSSAASTRVGALTVAVISASNPAAAYEYCYRQATSYMVSCGFDTMAQCKATAYGLGGDCLRDPFARKISAASTARREVLHAKNTIQEALGRGGLPAFPARPALDPRSRRQSDPS